MQILRAADRVAVPWKNGGGLTREVAAHPTGAGFGIFDWRISIAEVAASGPFSVFPGVDRWLAVLSGRLRLTVDGFGAVDLAPGDCLAFAGDAATYGEVLEGPVLDLNVMARRGGVQASVQRVDGTELQPGQVAVALGPATMGDLRLSAGDAVRLGSDDMPLDARGPLYVITFS